MGISKRKWISVIFTPLLSALLIISLFSGCSLKTAGDPLEILIDAPPQIYLQWAREDNLRSYLGYVYGESFKNVELEYLPRDEAERSVRLTALKTEVMAGGGPDVFLMFSYPPSGDGTYPERLFLDPRKAMEHGLFYPLDQYIPTARFFDPESFLKPALDAGKTEEGQMILPIALTFPVMIYQKNPEDLKKAKECALGATANSRLSRLLGELADYSNQKLLFTKEELMEVTKKALAAEQLAPVEEWYNSSYTNPERTRDMYIRTSPLENRQEGVGDPYYSPEKTGGLLSVQSLDRQSMRYWGPDDCYAFWAAHNGEPGLNKTMHLPEDRIPPYPGPQEIAPVYNMGNGVTAEITAYVCINRNTKRPDDAFRVVDFFYKPEVQSLSQEKDPECSAWYSFLLFYSCYGVPVQNDLLRNSHYEFGYDYIGKSNPDYISDFDPEGAEKLFSVYTGLRDQITTARFYGSLDEELQNMFNQCREADSDEEIEKLVSRAYETMTIMLGE